MYCSVKFFVPIVMTGASCGALPDPESSPSPQPARIRAAISPASAAVRRRRLISGQGRRVARRGLRNAFARGRQGEPEGAPVARLALRPDAAAVALDDPLADREPDAGALVVAVAVQAVER